MRVNSAGIAGVLIAIATPVFSLINTESLRRLDARTGLLQTTRFNFDYLSGNSNTLQVKPVYRVDYFDTDWHAFVVSELRYGNQDGTPFLNQAFIHARLMVPYTIDDTVELFLQSEYDDFRRVTSRKVVGVNQRQDLLKDQDGGVAAAAGVLYEDETNTIEGRRENVRLNTYVSGRIKLDTFTLNSTVYAQTRLDLLADFRVLSETSATSMVGSRNIGVNTTLKIAYDNMPPTGIKPLDLTLNSGIVVTF